MISESIIKSIYSTESYESTVSGLKEFFKDKFINVKYVGVESQLSIGQIVDIKVDGNTTYTQGLYDCTIPIIIEICAYN